MSKKVQHWILFVVFFSLLPVVVNLGWDYITTREASNFWRGVRLIDFLICGFCLIGGSLCDRYNSTSDPSGAAVGIGMILAAAAFGIYVYAKMTYAQPQTEAGVYVRETVFIAVIIGFYLLSIVYSMSLLQYVWRQNNE